MDSFEYKIKEFEVNVKSVMYMEDRSTFINKTFYDNDNDHQVTLYMRPYRIFEPNTCEEYYIVNYEIYDPFYHTCDYKFIKRYTNENFKATNDFVKIYNNWCELKRISNKDIFLKEHKMFQRKIEIESDFS